MMRVDEGFPLATQIGDKVFLEHHCHVGKAGSQISGIVFAKRISNERERNEILTDRVQIFSKL